MKTKAILLELIDLLESFEQTVGDVEGIGLDSFLTYALSIRKSNQESYSLSAIASTDEAYIAQMLSLLHRFSRGYMKKALQHSDCLQTEEEYTYLVCLLGGDALTKSELHLRNGLERTTGSEMLRRLQRHGLIEEQADEQDKRQRLVRITPKGRSELVKVFPNLRIAAQLLSAPLDERNKLFLKSLLTELCQVHSHLTTSLRDASLEQYLDAITGREGESH